MRTGRPRITDPDKRTFVWGIRVTNGKYKKVKQLSELTNTRANDILNMALDEFLEKYLDEPKEKQ